MKKLIDKLPKSLKQLVLYGIVGVISTIVEWGIFYILEHKTDIHYVPGTVTAFTIATIANWILGRLIIFKKPRSTVAKELVEIIIVSAVGLLLNLLLMWIFVDKLLIPEMISKMASTCIVFFWNFLIRKLVIYRV